MEREATPPAMKRLADYRPPDWLVPDIALDFRLDAERTLVHATLKVRRNGRHQRPLILDGDELELLELRMNGRELPAPNDSSVKLSIPIEGDEATVETLVAIRPEANSKLMGLYQSGAILCTQCEAEGFRRISYFPDRPDVLSRYRVRLEADRGRYPVLLSNGNEVAAGDAGEGRHFAVFEDPYPKPSYLFAAVAGKLAALRDRFRTRSRREVALAIWADEADVPRCRHAMDSLKAAMRFDEEEYGREYDLDSFNIVAVRDFNFGAMENKSLNIFNAKYILADHDTATDTDFDLISGVVAHEYFHNWSGNRVTCRDWFQLCLKEGFTVFRDQQFTASRNSAAVKRIETARTLRAQQFPEDDGPLAHPVRPESYLEISNFYTATIYEKGAELIRMIRRHLGPARFRRATDRYFAANDGRAATIEDFLAAMADEGLDARAFHRWYEQPGTPRVSVEALYHARTRQAELVFVQQNPKAPGAAPLPIPMDFALFSHDGRKLAERHDLLLTDVETRLLLDDIDEPPILSLNRDFAAPILAGPPPPPDRLLVLAAHEDDPFARYEAVQQLMLAALARDIATGEASGYDEVIEALGTLLDSWQQDPAFVAETMLPPSESLVGDRMALVDPEAIHRAARNLGRAIEQALAEQMWPIWRAADSRADDLSPHAKGLRRLKGVLLALLQANDGQVAAGAALRQFEEAASMTERMAALSALSHRHAAERQRALDSFYQRFRNCPEALDKWFLVQAQSKREDTLQAVRRLLRHPDYQARNPNRLRALLVGFGANQTRFHQRDGAGYRLLADETLAVDRFNPQSAARLVQPLTRWRRFAEPFGPLMRIELQRINSQPGISRDLTEVASNGLD